MTEHTVTTTVFATTEIVGFHFWPDAPEEVRYLKELHRHKFGIRAELSVVEHDREVEFHQLKSWLTAMLFDDIDANDYTNERNFRERSCESIAAELVEELAAQWPGRSLYRVTVDEDGENGAIVEARREDA